MYTKTSLTELIRVVMCDEIEPPPLIEQFKTKISLTELVKGLQC